MTLLRAFATQYVPCAVPVADTVMRPMAGELYTAMAVFLRMLLSAKLIVTNPAKLDFFSLPN